MRRADPRPLAAAALLVGVAAVVAFLLTRGDDVEPRPTAGPTSAAPSASASSAPPDEPSGFTPARVRIPTIDVDAPVVGLGTGDDGAQEVPERLDVTGWWRDGAQVDGPGSAAIVGHTASRGTAVFDRLGELAAGDRVSVAGRRDGERAAFVVRAVRTVPVEQFRRIAQAVYRTSGPTSLVLMTCGDYDGSDFRSTVVVVATPVRS
ncbi:class F sortase [Aeromicrobium sp. REDSEA-S38_B2]|uniref:class F sortase n=1 Tax=Aeromicrobium sp. REDSEA-S38_B2 TaxID=1811528 RepID=UPI00257DF3A5|nr:class F sortase [Aeromicrobium sp. REDSEA-S38_B2]